MKSEQNLTDDDSQSNSNIDNVDDNIEPVSLCDLECQLCWWFGEICDHGMFIDDECGMYCHHAWKLYSFCEHKITKCPDCNVKVFSEKGSCLVRLLVRLDDYFSGKNSYVQSRMIYMIINDFSD
jgi:hypothetical protein